MPPPLRRGANNAHSLRAGISTIYNKLCGRLPQYVTAPCKLTFDLLTSKVVSESILVFLRMSIFDLGPMYATDVKQTDTSDAHHRLMPPPYGDGA